MIAKRRTATGEASVSGRGDHQGDAQHHRTIGVHGARFALGLMTGFAGQPDDYQGWRGFLQMAADFSHQDPELLTIADEVYARAGELGDPGSLRRFAEDRLARHPGASARGFLEGVVLGLRAADRHAGALQGEPS